MDFCLVPLGIVLVISIATSFFASKRESDFFLASRSIRWPMLIGTFIGLHVGGGFILGNADAAWNEGIVGSMYGLGLAFGMLFLGLGCSARLRSLEVATLPELLAQRFGSPLLKRAAGLLAVACLGGILIAQALGIWKFLLSLGFSNPLIFVATWGSVVLYTAFGGLLAVVWTDTIQAVVMVVMLLVTLCCALLPHWSEISTQAISMGVQWSGVSAASLIFPLCYIFVTQDIAQRCFAAHSPSDARKGCLGTAAALALLTVIPTACGILGKALHVTPEDGSVFMQVVQKLSHPIVFVMAASAVLLAIVSTTSAVLLALGSNVAHDITTAGTKGRLITSAIGICAMAGPWIGGDIISWIVTCNELAVGAVFLPVLYSLFSKRPLLPKEAAWGSFVFGTAGTLLSHVDPANLLGALAPLAFSFVGFVGGLIVGKKEFLAGNQELMAE
jgi:SSS family solute:Na+ symporter